MSKVIFRYGIIAGLIATLPWVAWMLTLPADAKGLGALGGYVTGYLIMLVALSMIYLGVRQYRDKALGGHIRFGKAFLLGIGISAVASVLYALGWEVCVAFSKFDFMAFYARSIPDPAAAREFIRTYSNPAYRMAYTFIEMFPVGLVVSLICAAILRRR